MAECCIQKVPQDIKGIDEFTSQWRQNCRRNEQFLSPLQHKTRARHF